MEKRIKIKLLASIGVFVGITALVIFTLKPIVVFEDGCGSSIGAFFIIAMASTVVISLIWHKWQKRQRWH